MARQKSTFVVSSESFVFNLLVGKSGACGKSDDHAAPLVWQVDQGTISRLSGFAM